MNEMGGELYWHRDKYYINLQAHCGFWHSYKKKALHKKKKKKFVVYDKIRWDPVKQKPVFNDHAFAHSSNDTNKEHSCSLEGTHFLWQDGSQKRTKKFEALLPDMTYFRGLFGFVEERAPRLWLNEEQWFPSEVEFFLEKVKPKAIDGKIWATTVSKLDNPWAVKKFFYGQSIVDGKGPTVHTFVLPSDKTLDPLLQMFNPQNATIRVAYMFFYPYNHGPDILGKKLLHMGNHVGDIETMSITFKQGQPEKVFFATHDWGIKQNWKEVEQEEGHPVGYVARGTHATYPSEGEHKSVMNMITDYTAKKTQWRTELSVEMHLPWDWTAKKIEGIRQWAEAPYWIT